MWCMLRLSPASCALLLYTAAQDLWLGCCYIGWVRLLGMSPVCDSEKTVCCGKSPINRTRNFNIFSFAGSPRVHKGFPPLRTPTEKNMQKNRTLFVRP